MSIMMYMLRHIRTPTICFPKPAQVVAEMILRESSSTKEEESTSKPKYSPRMEEFKKKLQEVPYPIDKPMNREITPIRKLDQKNIEQPKMFEYESWPNNTNPHTGEIGGPKGPEPTRYGDWERKGRVSDF